MTRLSDDREVVQRILDHIDNRTTDLGEACWREPVENYVSEKRFAAEMHLVLRRYPTPFCPSAALPDAGSYLAREAAGTPILAVRGDDGRVRAFRNACRHRGTMLAEGAGCEKAFVCRYHGWTYALDGALRHVPHEYGFPGLDKNERGLVPVSAVESNGLVFVTQEPSGITGAVDAIPDLFYPSHRLLGCSEEEVVTNWKIVTEGFLEGYHIRSTHRETFYPIQYDNLNVVERFGRNSRIAFPYRRIEKLRALPPEQRSVQAMLTYVYHLFPNVMVATFPYTILMVVLEPLAIDRTRILTYALTDRTSRPEDDQEPRQRSQDFLLAGTVEDRAVARSVQRGLGSGANEIFEFGRFEAAIGHFHRSLHALIDDAPAVRAEPARARRA